MKQWWQSMENGADWVIFLWTVVESYRCGLSNDVLKNVKARTVLIKVTFFVVLGTWDKIVPRLSAIHLCRMAQNIGKLNQCAEKNKTGRRAVDLKTVPLKYQQNRAALLLATCNWRKPQINQNEDGRRHRKVIFLNSQNFKYGYQAWVGPCQFFFKHVLLTLQERNFCQHVHSYCSPSSESFRFIATMTICHLVSSTKANTCSLTCDSIVWIHIDSTLNVSIYCCN